MGDKFQFPLSPEKYSSVALINPEDFIRHAQEAGFLRKKSVAAKIVFSFLPIRTSKSQSHRFLPAEPFLHAQMQQVKGADIAVCSNFGLGSPSLCLLLEVLVAMGANEFIGVGPAGSLSSDLKVGDLVLCSKALRDEGLSYHYLPPSDYAWPDETLCQRLQMSLESKSLPYRKAPTWTTDAIYRETESEVQKYRELGVLAVDMEAAALFTVAQYRKVKAASVFAISDRLTGLGWVPDFRAAGGSLKTLLDVAIDALNR